MNTLKKAMWMMAKSKGLEQDNVSEAYHRNADNSNLPDGLIRVDDTLYKYPESPTTDDLLSMLIFTNAKIEQHLRFIKGTIIAGIVVAIVSALLGLIV